MNACTIIHQIFIKKIMHISLSIFKPKTKCIKENVFIKVMSMSTLFCTDVEQQTLVEYKTNYSRCWYESRSIMSADSPPPSLTQSECNIPHCHAIEYNGMNINLRKRTSFCILNKTSHL